MLPLKCCECGPPNNYGVSGGKNLALGPPKQRKRQIGKMTTLPSLSHAADCLLHMSNSHTRPCTSTGIRGKISAPAGWLRHCAGKQVQSHWNRANNKKLSCCKSQKATVVILFQMTLLSMFEQATSVSVHGFKSRQPSWQISHPFHLWKLIFAP